MATIVEQDTYLLEATGYDPVTDANVGIYASSCRYEPVAADSTPTLDWIPGLTVSGFASTVWSQSDRLIGGMTDAREGVARVPIPRLNNGVSPLLQAWLRYAWTGMTATIYKIVKGGTYATKTVYIKGTLTGATASRSEVAWTIASFNAVLAKKKLHETKYLGRPNGVRFAGEPYTSYATAGDKCDLTGSFTIQWVFRVDAFNAAYGYLVDKAQAGVGSYSVYVNSTGTVTLKVVNGANSWTHTSTVALTVGLFVELTAVYDTTANTAQFFVNAKADPVGTGKNYDPVNTTGALTLATSLVDTGHSLACTIAELRIWSKALTQDEITDYLYFGSLASTTSGLVCWLRISEISGTTLNDETATNADFTLTGAALAFALYDAVATGSAHGKMDPAVPSTTTMTSGWTVGTTGATNYSEFLYGTERAASTFGATALPNSAPGTTDCFRSESKVSFSFAGGNFSLAIRVVAVTLGGTQDGNLRARIWIGAAPDGSDAVEVTSGATDGSVVTNLTTATPQISTITCAVSAFTCFQKYVFAQLAWKITGAGGGAGCDVLLRAGVSTVTTTTANPLFVGTYEGDYTLAGRGKPYGLGWNNHVEPLLVDYQKQIYAVSAGGIFSDAIYTFDGGVSLTKDTSVDDLWSLGSVAAGHFATDTARGLIRWGGSGPAKHPSVHFSGNASGAIDGQCSDIVTGPAGFVGADYDVVTSDSYTVEISGYWTSDGSQVTCAEALQQIAQSWRARVGFDYDGVFRGACLNRADLPASASLAITTDDFDAASLSVVATIPAVREVTCHFKLYQPPLPLSEIDTSLSADRKADLQRAWRIYSARRDFDLYGRDFDNYGEDARRITFDTLTLSQGGSLPAVPAVLGILDTHSAISKVIQLTLVNPDVRPANGDRVTLTCPEFGCDAGVDFLVVSTSRDVPDARSVVQLFDITGLLG